MMIVEVSRAHLLQHIGMAKPGQWIMYHVGFLMVDRTKNRRLNAAAHEAWAQYLSEQVCLVQRRLGDKQYEYYCIKR